MLPSHTNAAPELGLDLGLPLAPSLFGLECHQILVVSWTVRPNMWSYVYTYTCKFSPRVDMGTNEFKFKYLLMFPDQGSCQLCGGVLSMLVLGNCLQTCHPQLTGVRFLVLSFELRKLPAIRRSGSEIQGNVHLGPLDGEGELEVFDTAPFIDAMPRHCAKVRECSRD